MLVTSLFLRLNVVSSLVVILNITSLGCSNSYNSCLEFTMLLSVLLSFHVGSGCYDPNAYHAAVESARNVFDIAERAGFNFTLLDIGGGFPGQDSAKLSFREVIICFSICLSDKFYHYRLYLFSKIWLCELTQL